MGCTGFLLTADNCEHLKVSKVKISCSTTHVFILNLPPVCIAAQWQSWAKMLVVCVGVEAESNLKPVAINKIYESAIGLFADLLSKLHKFVYAGSTVRAPCSP